MTTLITKKWLLEHGFVQKPFHQFTAWYPFKTDTIDIYMYSPIQFNVEGERIRITGDLKEGSVEELEKYIDICELSEEFLNAFKLNKGGEE